jgi:hypothetical protein
MGEWGKGDPTFNKLFVRMFGTDDAETRRKIFKRVCIPFRLTLYLSLFYLCRFTPVIIIIIIATAISIISLFPSIKNPGEQWWSRRWHLLLASIIFIIACSGLLIKNAETSKVLLQYVIPSLFVVDLIPGLHAAIML